MKFVQQRSSAKMARPKAESRRDGRGSAHNLIQIALENLDVVLSKFARDVRKDDAAARFSGALRPGLREAEFTSAGEGFPRANSIHEVGS